MRLKSLLQKLPLFSDKGDSADRTTKEKQRAKKEGEDCNPEDLGAKLNLEILNGRAPDCGQRTCILQKL